MKHTHLKNMSEAYIEAIWCQIIPLLHHFSSWWLNHPSEKKKTSNWMIISNIWDHHPVFFFNILHPNFTYRSE